MLVHTPEGNISRAMRHVSGVYTQRFNSRHHLDGQLFRGRYKSILVGGDSYLLQLVRYIHRNPLRAGLVDDLKAYSWSSHKAYLSVALTMTLRARICLYPEEGSSMNQGVLRSICCEDSAATV